MPRFLYLPATKKWEKTSTQTLEHISYTKVYYYLQGSVTPRFISLTKCFQNIQMLDYFFNRVSLVKLKQKINQCPSWQIFKLLFCPTKNTFFCSSVRRAFASKLRGPGFKSWLGIVGGLVTIIMWGVLPGWKQALN